MGDVMHPFKRWLQNGEKILCFLSMGGRPSTRLSLNLDIFRSWITVPITLCSLRGEVRPAFFSRVPWHVKQYIGNSQMSVIYMLQNHRKFLIFRRLWGPTLVQTKVISYIYTRVARHVLFWSGPICQLPRSAIPYGGCCMFWFGVGDAARKL